MAISTVEGKVGRVFFDGKGAEIVEEFTVRGEQVKKRWAAFFDAPHGLSEGASVKVSGMHGDKIDEWPDKETQQTRRAVKRTLNKARIEGQMQEPPSGTYQDTTPF